MDYRPPADCAKYFPTAECNNWVLAPWLPQYNDAFAAWQKNAATLISAPDAIVYDGALLAGKIGVYLPQNGSPFTYGKAGPPRGQVVYDRVHRIALYGQGCCSWAEVVLAADVPRPPRAVAEQNLASVHTSRGVRLGMTTAQVQAIYGRAPLKAVPSFPEVQQIAYTTVPPPQPNAKSAQCGQFENFYFRNNRLILIQMATGC
jgi:hypothetical protein